MPNIVPAILVNDNELLVEELKTAEHFADRIQIDVMDGSFVPFESTAGNGLTSPCHLEAHLMIDDPNPANYSNFDTIIVHAEACNDLGRTIAQIKALDIRAGIAINPETGVDKIKEHIPEADQILILAVHPGKQGQQFMPEVLDKVKRIKQEFPEKIVEVDGGINENNIHEVKESGADLIAVGHSLFKDENFKENFKSLLRAE